MGLCMRRSLCGSYFVALYFAHAFVSESISTEVWKEEEDFRSCCIQLPAVSTAEFYLAFYSYQLRML